MAFPPPNVASARARHQQTTSAIVVFARSPRDAAQPGFGGSAPTALRLHTRLLEQALRTAAAVAGAEVHLVTTGPLDEASRLARTCVPAERLSVRAQQGPSAARRLDAAVAGAFAAGASRVVVIGVDSPELRPSHLRRALAHLAAAAPRAVVGPARDGGYYLLGLSRYSAAPFAAMRFGSPEVLAQTLGALDAAGFSVDQLEPLDDLDQRPDLLGLVQRLRARRQTGDLVSLLLAVLADPLAPLPSLPIPALRTLGGPLCARGPPRSLPIPVTLSV